MSAWYDTTRDEMLDAFETDQQTTLRVDTDTLVFASSVELLVGQGEPPYIALRTGVLPSQMMRLLEPLEMKPIDVVAYRPHEPVYLTWLASDRLVESYTRARAEGRSLEWCVTSKDLEGFPAFFDLENYHFEHAAQRRVDA